MDDTPMLPNFFIAGFAKSGTTSLYHYLKQHPKIYMSPVKEPHFFSHGERELEIFKGPKIDLNHIKDLPDYCALYNGVRDETAIGEASCSNSGKRACERIRKYVPHAKIVFILRHPADKIYSQFQHLRNNLIEPCDELVDAINHELSGGREDWAHFLRYCHNTFFYDKMKYYFECFPAEQIRIYLYEDWSANPEFVLKDIFTFLGVDPDYKIDTSKRHNVRNIPISKNFIIFFNNRFLRNAAKLAIPLRTGRDFLKYVHDRVLYKKAKPMDPSLRSFLTEHFKDDILDTQELIGRDLSHWLADGN
jgi:hypothetical protein